MPQQTAKARWTRRARRDLGDIWRYYAEAASDKIANEVVRLMTEAADRAAQRPLTWRARDDVAPGLRAVRVRSHLIFYRLRSKEIEVLRILHERRDIRAEFKYMRTSGL